METEKELVERRKNALRKYKERNKEKLFFCICEVSRKKCRDDDACNKEVPYLDHVRTFVDKKTGERIFTIQPYVNRDGRTYYASGPLAEITKASEEFAKAHGLSVRLSVEDSWWAQDIYFTTVLIEYRKAKEGV
jgi:hypothetical protein